MSYQVSSVLIADPANLSSEDWLLGVNQDSSVSLPLDSNDNVLFSGTFVPPPPRPLFLEEGVTSDGLTTCDLCSWAWQNGNSYATDTRIEPTSELGWVLTLVIVSITSAVLGAIVMIVVLQCRRLKKSSSSTENQDPPPRPPISTPDDKLVIQQNYPPNQTAANSVWSWLSRRSITTPSQLDNPPLSFVENHYTHMEDPYNSVDDALYAELDSESVDKREPSYQNSAYTDSDAPTSSAPSSAYYSDLSVSTERAYEVVGLAPLWDAACGKNKKLEAISESVNVPSDYV